MEHLSLGALCGLTASVANILANGAYDWWYSGWGYPNYYCNAAIFRLPPDYVTATVRTHNQNQGHAWHDLGAHTRSPNVH
jgi:hypothetical protein